MEKPFVFGVAVGNENFIGRVKEQKVLAEHFRYGINTILMAPRRMGKTSLVRRVAANINSEEIRVVYLDIFACRSEYDFLNAFAAAILKQTSSHLEEWKQYAQEFLSRLAPKISFSPEPLQDFSLSLGITPKNYKPEDVLNLPEMIAQKKHCHVIMCIDEFQQIGDFPDSLTVQKRMRSVWQHQENVSYCIFGSKKNMMNALFQQSSKPFYKFGTTMSLGCIPTEDWVPYLCNQFASVGKHLTHELAVAICNKVELHSSYVQQLAFNTLLCTDGESPTEENITEAYNNLLDENTALFLDKTERLTTYQLNFLRAILNDIHSDFGKTEIREEYNLGSASNIKRIKDALLEKELIDITTDGAFIADPVMKDWLKLRLLL